MSESKSALTYSSGLIRSMNSDVEISLSVSATEFEKIVNETVEPFLAEFEQTCSRFIPDNPLAQLNNSPNESVEVPALLFEAVKVAADAFERSNGLFDPRVISTLKAIGYADSFETGSSPRGSLPSTHTEMESWRPQFEHVGSSYKINLSGAPIDLGGIGKGLAVDLLSASLRESAPSGFVNAGGDLQAWGHSREGTAWRIGVENPFDSSEADPLAVLEISDTGLATSSVRKRRWKTQHGDDVHHLVNPKTGRPANSGLVAVTVVHKNTNVAETLTKTLFIEGESSILETCNGDQIAALWVTTQGEIGYSDSMKRHLIWMKP